MKVSELIQKLQDFDPQARVVVVGYEYGFDDVDVISTIPLMLNQHKKYWEREHDTPNSDETADESAVVIRSTRR